MKITLLLLIMLLGALPVAWAESPRAGADLLESVVVRAPERTSRSSKVALLARESHLSRELEVAPQDPATLLEVASADDWEYELRLPEDVLPESDIPLALNDKVSYFIRYFQSSGRNGFSHWLSRSERYIPMMKEVLKKEGLPEDLVYLAMIESGFSPHAFSVASAVGPWQFMSGTGKRYSLRIDGWIDERRDPLKSTIAAALYLKELYGLFNKDWYLAAAGYNAGENKILRAIGMYNSNNFWEISKGSYLKRETKDYVPKLLAAAIIAKEPAKYGFADVAYLPPIEFDTLTIPAQTDLAVVAEACGVTYDTIRDLNPELRRWATPPDFPDYQLKIPKGKRAVCETEYAAVPADKRYTEKTVQVKYRVRKKDTLEKIAERFGTTPQVVAGMNKLGPKSKLRGRTLLVPVKTALLDRNKPVVNSVAGKEVNKYYTVKRGDTLPLLAKRFNVSTRLLAAWNNLRGKLTLRAGRRIIIAKFIHKDGAITAVTEKS